MPDPPSLGASPWPPKARPSASHAPPVALRQEDHEYGFANSPGRVIILHAACCNGSFLLWAEASRDETAPLARRRRKEKAAEEASTAEGGGARTAPFPWEASRHELLAVLEAAGIKRTAAARRSKGPQRRPTARATVPALLWAPTVDGTALPSSPLIAESPKATNEPRVAPWTLSTLRLTRAETVELLCACIGKQTLGPGLVVGPDLASWALVLQFAGSLVARQRYLPSVRDEDGAYRACWDPLLAQEDSGRLAELAARMPAVARALSDLYAQTAPELSAALALSGFVEAMVDHLARPPAAAAAPKPTACSRSPSSATSGSSRWSRWGSR